ncbi:hypothetical protein HYS31_08410 [Candidatus Woesearchaeota archaeon]|nr:hypothetical protein [Candidatus Woesearchaeota archaeon]
MEESPVKRNAKCKLCRQLGQSSLEYLIIVAITFAIIVPTTYIFYSYSKESGQEISDAQAARAGKAIVDAAQSIFYSGQGSKTTLELNMPDNVASAVIIDGKELVFNITTNFGVSELVFFSPVSITTSSLNCNGNVCNLPGLGSPGIKKVRIEALADQVKIEVI